MTPGAVELAAVAPFLDVGLGLHPQPLVGQKAAEHGIELELEGGVLDQHLAQEVELLVERVAVVAGGLALDAEEVLLVAVLELDHLGFELGGAIGELLGSVGAPLDAGPHELVGTAPALVGGHGGMVSRKS